MSEVEKLSCLLFDRLLLSVHIDWRNIKFQQPEYDFLKMYSILRIQSMQLGYNKLPPTPNTNQYHHRFQNKDTINITRTVY